MLTIEVHAQIQRPIDEVFVFLADFTANGPKPCFCASQGVNHEVAPATISAYAM